MNKHHIVNGCTVITTASGNHSFQGTTRAEMETHIAGVERELLRLTRQREALWDFLTGATVSAYPEPGSPFRPLPSKQPTNDHFSPYGY